MRWLVAFITSSAIGFGVYNIDAKEDHKPAAASAKLDKTTSLADFVRDASVMVTVQRGSGSGVIVTTSDGSVYVWTAGHVVEGNRNVSTVVDSNTGSSRTTVSFSDVKISRVTVRDGRTVGKIEQDAEVIRYSNADNGEDLALLRVRDRSFKSGSIKFYLDEAIPDVDTPICHCGSWRGAVGANSFSRGIVSYTGRLWESQVYDQSGLTAHPGSSGGGVFLSGSAGEPDGRCIGLIVLGYSENFNMYVPARRIRAWAKKVGVEFAVDTSMKTPSDQELKSKPIEDSIQLTPSGGSQKGNRHFQRLFHSIIAE